MGWTPKWWFWPLGVLALVIFVGVVFIVPPLLVHEPRLAEPDEARALADYRANMLQMFPGLAVLGAGLLTWWRIQIAQQQVRVSEEGQITERYSRAVEQLGHEGLDVRIGGIYALERIAVDARARAPRGASTARDQVTVVEVLSRFVHTHLSEGRPEDWAAPEPVTARSVKWWHPAADAEAALSVLSRLGLTPVLARIDARGAHLRRARLDGADLTDADLSMANLSNAHLYGGHLRRASLAHANLADADLGKADLREADLDGADLDGADLDRADLTGARLRTRSLEGASLVGSIHDSTTKWPDGFLPPTPGNR